MGTWMATRLSSKEHCRSKLLQQQPESPADIDQAQRAMVAASMVCPEKFGDVIAEMYDAFWVEHEAIQTPQVSLPVIADVVGDDRAREIARKVSLLAIPINPIRHSCIT